MGKFSCDFSGFSNTYQRMLSEAEELSKVEAKAPKTMRTYQDSDKSKKVVGSMIKRKDSEKKDSEDLKKAGKKKNKANKVGEGKEIVEETAVVCLKNHQEAMMNMNGTSAVVTNGVADCLDEKTIEANKQKLFARGKKTLKAEEMKQSPGDAKKRGKVNRQWELGGKSRDAETLDYSRDKGDIVDSEVDLAYGKSLLGQMVGELKDIESEDDEISNSKEDIAVADSRPAGSVSEKGGKGFGFLNSLRSLVSSKTLTHTVVEPVLDKMRDHLIAKNVASDIAEKLCDSVATKLKGRVLGTFDTVAATVRTALMESCTQILTPHRRVDILRDAMDSRHRGVPYVAVFCGVNGVGKSTNLAKICFWLIENGLRVLIAACDTFRAGAVEQLRTHCRKLNALHPQLSDGRQAVQLYEKGYGKDAAGIASEAISHARSQKFDVVLVDTAGRMQDNVPLMQSLTKLIKVCMSVDYSVIFIHVTESSSCDIFVVYSTWMSDAAKFTFHTAECTVTSTIDCTENAEQENAAAKYGMENVGLENVGPSNYVHCTARSNLVVAVEVDTK